MVVVNVWSCGKWLMDGLMLMLVVMVILVIVVVWCWKLSEIFVNVGIIWCVLLVRKVFLRDCCI